MLSKHFSLITTAEQYTQYSCNYYYLRKNKASQENGKPFNFRTKPELKLLLHQIISLFILDFLTEKIPGNMFTFPELEPEQK